MCASPVPLLKAAPQCANRAHRDPASDEDQDDVPGFLGDIYSGRREVERVDVRDGS